MMSANSSQLAKTRDDERAYKSNSVAKILSFDANISKDPSASPLEATTQASNQEYAQDIMSATGGPIDRREFALDLRRLLLRVARIRAEIQDAQARLARPERRPSTRTGASTRRIRPSGL